MRFNKIFFVQLTGTRSSKGTGGGLEFHERLAKQLIRDGFDVFAITNNLDESGFKFLEDRRLVANFRSFSESIMSIFLFNPNKLKLELGRIIRETNFNSSVFVTIDPFPMDIFGAILLRQLGAIHIAITMYHITPSPLWHPFRRGIWRVFPAWLVSIFALSISKIKELPLFLDNPRISVSSGWRINKLLDLPLALERYDHSLPDSRERIVVFTGRISYNKGVVDLIKAWKIISEEVEDSKLILIGTNHIQNKLLKLLRNYSVEKSVEIKGYIPNSEKELILKHASIFLFPSYEEGWALSVMEAVDQGLLPLTYNLAAFDYLGDKAIRIKPGNYKEMAKKTIYYLQNSEERIQLIKEMQKQISKYTMDYVTDHWINELEKI